MENENNQIQQKNHQQQEVNHHRTNEQKQSFQIANDTAKYKIQYCVRTTLREVVIQSFQKYLSSHNKTTNQHVISMQQQQQQQQQQQDRHHDHDDNQLDAAKTDDNEKDDVEKKKEQKEQHFIIDLTTATTTSSSSKVDNMGMDHINDNDNNDNDNDTSTIMNHYEQMIDVAKENCLLLSNAWCNEWKKCGHEQVIQWIEELVHNELSTLFDSNNNNDNNNESNNDDEEEEKDIENDTVDGKEDNEDNNNNKNNNSNYNSNNDINKMYSIIDHIEHEKDKDPSDNINNNNNYNNDNDSHGKTNNMHTAKNDDIIDEEITSSSLLWYHKLKNVGHHDVLSENDNYIPNNIVIQQLDEIGIEKYGNNQWNTINQYVKTLPSRLIYQNNSNHNPNNHIDDDDYNDDDRSDAKIESKDVMDQSSGVDHNSLDNSDDDDPHHSHSDNINNVNHNDTFTKDELILIHRKRKFNHAHKHSLIKKIVRSSNKKNDEPSSSRRLNEQNDDNNDTDIPRLPSQCHDLQFTMNDIKNKLSVHEKQKLSSNYIHPEYNNKNSSNHDNTSDNDNDLDDDHHDVTAYDDDENTNNNNNTSMKIDNTLFGELCDVGLFHYRQQEQIRGQQQNRGDDDDRTKKQIRRHQRDAIRERLGDHILCTTGNNQGTNSATALPPKIDMSAFEQEKQQQQEQQHDDEDDHDDDKSIIRNKSNIKKKKKQSSAFTSRILRTIERPTSSSTTTSITSNKQYNAINNDTRKRKRRHWFDFDLRHCMLELAEGCSNTNIHNDNSNNDNSDKNDDDRQNKDVENSDNEMNHKKQLYYFSNVEVMVLDESDNENLE